MKKIIEGRTYNTETAKLMGEHTHSNRTDFAYYHEELYRNNRGTWFLYGEGGPASKYAKRVEQNTWSGGTAITPLSEDEVREWAEMNLSTDEYEEIFGEQEEATPSDLTTRERVNVVLDQGLIDKVRAYSKASGIPISRLMDEAIALLKEERNF